MTRSEAETSTMYVGYRPVPAQMKRSLAVVAPGVALVLALIASVLAATQRSPGGGVWEGTQTTLAGTLVSEPLAAMIVREEATGPRVVLLVEEGKHGAARRVSAAAGLTGTVRGTRLTRASMEMVEISEVVTGEGAGGATPEVVWEEGQRMWRGEVVDAKCFLGAMKPGDGKTHKACATLCVRNGIPAMLVTDAGTMAVVPPVPAVFFDVIGEPVEVMGREGKWANMPVVGISSVRRVGVVR